MDDAMASSMDEEIGSYIGGFMDTHGRHLSHPVLVPIIRVSTSMDTELRNGYATLQCRKENLGTSPVSLLHTGISTPTILGVFRGPLGGFKSHDIVNYAFIPSLP